MQAHTRAQTCVRVCVKYSTLKCLQFAHKMSHVDSARRRSGCGDVGVVFHTSRLWAPWLCLCCCVWQVRLETCSRAQRSSPWGGRRWLLYTRLYWGDATPPFPKRQTNKKKATASRWKRPHNSGMLAWVKCLQWKKNIKKISHWKCSLHFCLRVLRKVLRRLVSVVSHQHRFRMLEEKNKQRTKPPVNRTDIIIAPPETKSAASQDTTEPSCLSYWRLWHQCAWTGRKLQSHWRNSWHK